MCLQTIRYLQEPKSYKALQEKMGQYIGCGKGGTASSMEVRDATREVVILVIDHRRDVYRRDFTSG